MRYGHEVLEAAWDEDAERWADPRPARATSPLRSSISAVGALADPSIPDLPGLDRSRARVFHSARWDHGHDLTGRRVAVVGTGASAIQFVPEIQPTGRPP